MLTGKWLYCYLVSKRGQTSRVEENK